MAIQLEDYLTLSQAAQLVHTSKDTLLKEVRAGRLRTVKPGRTILTTRQWLEQWLNKKGAG